MLAFAGSEAGQLEAEQTRWAQRYPRAERAVAAAADPDPLLATWLRLLRDQFTAAAGTAAAPGERVTRMRELNEELGRLLDLHHDHAGTAGPGSAAPGLVPQQAGEMLTPASLNYFTGVQGVLYQQFARQSTRYVGAHGTILVPDPGRFHWLKYTGSRQNRSYFTQLLLATAARAKLADNQARHGADARRPRLIEPFAGAGQVFLNAAYWGPALFNQGEPLFESVAGGDLSPFLIGVYRVLQQPGPGFAPEYAGLAAAWDADLAGSYARLVAELDASARAALAGPAARPAAARLAACMYIWVTNRSDRGKLGSIDQRLTPAWVTTIRTRETRALDSAQQLLRELRPDLGVRDFEDSCALAGPQDIVFMDPPYPAFTTAIPPAGQPHPERYATRATSHYRHAGAQVLALQTRVVAAARRLIAQGTTVIVYNHASPGLIRAYADLTRDSLTPAQRRRLIYTHRSPMTNDQAYQLAILPGHGSTHVTQIPAAVLAQWLAAGGDDYENEEFFTPSHQWTAEDNQYQLPFTQREMDWRDAGPGYAASHTSGHTSSGDSAGDTSSDDDSPGGAAARPYQDGPPHFWYQKTAQWDSWRGPDRAMIGPDDDDYYDDYPGAGSPPPPPPPPPQTTPAPAGTTTRRAAAAPRPGPRTTTGTGTGTGTSPWPAPAATPATGTGTGTGTGTSPWPAPATTPRRIPRTPGRIPRSIPRSRSSPRTTPAPARTATPAPAGPATRRQGALPAAAAGAAGPSAAARALTRPGRSGPPGGPGPAAHPPARLTRRQPPPGSVTTHASCRKSWHGGPARTRRSRRRCGSS